MVRPALSMAETPCSGINTVTGPPRGVEFGGGDPSDFCTLFRCRAHQRHGRVMNVEFASPETIGNRSYRPKVHHINRAGTDNLRNALRRRPPPDGEVPHSKRHQPVRPQVQWS